MIPFSQFFRFERAIPLPNPLTDCIDQIENNSIVARQSNRSNDHTFMLNTTTTSDPAFSRPPLVPLNSADAYSLSSGINNPYQIITDLNANAHPSQRLYQNIQLLVYVFLQVYFQYLLSLL